MNSLNCGHFPPKDHNSRYGRDLTNEVARPASGVQDQTNQRIPVSRTRLRRDGGWRVCIPWSKGPQGTPTYYIRRQSYTATVPPEVPWEGNLEAWKVFLDS
jgi:hypothetical protein